MNELVDADVLEGSFHVLKPGVGQETEDIEIQEGADTVECPVRGKNSIN